MGTVDVPGKVAEEQSNSARVLPEVSCWAWARMAAAAMRADLKRCMLEGIVDFLLQCRLGYPIYTATSKYIPRCYALSS